MSDNVAILDKDGATKIIRTREKTGGVHQQIVEQAETTPWSTLDLGTTGQVVASARAFLHSWQISNLAADVVHVKVYDKASAATASDTPKKVFSVLPGQPFPYGDSVTNGIDFTLGISVRATYGTAGLANASTAAPPTNGCVANLDFRLAV